MKRQVGCLLINLHEPTVRHYFAAPLSGTVASAKAFVFGVTGAAAFVAARLNLDSGQFTIGTLVIVAATCYVAADSLTSNLILCHGGYSLR